MKKLAVFDLGQVCVRIHVERCNEVWLKKAELDSMGKGEFDYQAHDEFERGEISSAQLWAALRKSFGLQLSDADWLEGWNSIFGEEISQTRETVVSMKEARLRLVVLSNTNKEHCDIWKPMYSEFLDLFDAIYVSNELGARKPEPRIYEKVLSLEGVEADEAVFFDDKLENIEAARDQGIEGVHFTHDASALDWWAANRSNSN